MFENNCFSFLVHICHDQWCTRVHKNLNMQVCQNVDLESHWIMQPRRQYTSYVLKESKRFHHRTIHQIKQITKIYTVKYLHIPPIFGIKQPNKIRQIHHLSYLKKPKNRYDYSDNELLEDKWKTAQYTTFREVVKMVVTAESGAFLLIVDAADAYYRLPIHKDDHHLMRMHWANHYWFFTCVRM